MPVFRPSDHIGGKYAVLSEFDSVHSFDSGTTPDPEWFVGILGQAGPEPKARESVAQVADYWDKVASIFTNNDRSATRDLVGRFWQSHPVWLEAQSIERRAATDALQMELEMQQRDASISISERDQQIATLNNLITTDREAARQEIDRISGVLVERDQQIQTLNAAVAERDRQIREAAAAQEDQLTELHNSTSWKLTAPVRWIGRKIRWRENRRVMDLSRFEQEKMASAPYEWAFVNNLFPTQQARALVTSYPRDNFKTVKGYDGEKGYEYEARALIHLGAGSVASPEGLSEVWRALAEDLLSPGYRAAMTRLTGRDLTTAPMEAYVCHFGPGAWLGPHLDLKAKIVTHVFYFNSRWDREDGGCMNILGSSDMSDVVAVIEPIVGNSSILVRSDKSWHSVSRVAEGCTGSRRSMNVIFYHPGAVSTMWPPGDSTPLHFYDPPE